MKCPKCGNELEEGKLLCEKCGEEVKFVPVFDIELEDKLRESISSMLEDMDEAKDETPADETGAQETQGGFEETDDEDELDKDELGDYVKPIPFSTLAKKRFFIVIAVAVVFVVGGIFYFAYLSRQIRQTKNSYDYQYKKAVEAAQGNDYDTAIDYLERALAVDDTSPDARFLLAQYYYEAGMSASAVSALKEILSQDTDYEGRSDVYDFLLAIYEEEGRYDEMGELLAECDVSEILTKYNEYAALAPEFNKEGGKYDEVISITISGNTTGTVYYTLDGSLPTLESAVYEMPILLEQGEYIIRAIFVNSYGTSSEAVTQNYQIEPAKPDIPEVSLESGTYSEPCLIEVYYSANTRIYYTTDGSEPSADSTRYTGPIELPYGVSNFSFIAVNSYGIASDAVSRSYELSVEANFDTELALQVLRNSLYAAGKLSDADGSVNGKLGFNRYEVSTAAYVGESLYYIVSEEYVDTTGNAHGTGNIYAIDVNTAQLYAAYKLDEGVYRLENF